MLFTHPISGVMREVDDSDEEKVNRLRASGWQSNVKVSGPSGEPAAESAPATPEVPEQAQPQEEADAPVSDEAEAGHAGLQLDEGYTTPDE